MKGQDMALIQEIPHQRIEIVGFLGKLNVKVVGEDISDFIKALQSAVIVDNSLRAAEIGA
jgi:hypothetical protein